MAEIGTDRLGKGILVVNQQRNRAVDPVAPDGMTFGHGGGKCGLLPGQHGPHAVHFGIAH